MNPFGRLACAWLLPVAIAAAGCENISLIKREDPLAREEFGRARDIDRNSELRRDLDRGRDQLTGSVQRIDIDRQEVQLRTTDGQLTRIRYDLSTRVVGHDRDMRVDDLRNGDLVRIELSRDRGERFAEFISLNTRADAASRY
jgi:hypothetical protein